jgi:hypothetical protein
MPDQKMIALCTQISTEKDPKKLMALAEELIKLLDEEQNEIKAKIRANIGRSTVSPE